MALIHANPFSFFNTAQILRVFTSKIEAGTISIGAFGRDGGPGLRFSGDHGDVLKLDASPADATCIQQFDIRLSEADVAHGNNGIASVYDGATEQVTLTVNSDLTFSIYRGDFSGTLLGTSSYTIPVGTFIHVGWKNVIGNSGSSRLEVWEDGDTAAQVVLNLTSVDTQNTASAQWTQHGIGASSEGDTDFCNYVVMDGSGSNANDLLGPCDVLGLFANARLTPSLTDWSLSSGSSVSALLDDSTPDDDTTYLEETTQNQQMTVGVDPLPYTSIVGAELFACVKLTSGSPTLKAIGYQSGTPNLGADFSPTASYTYLMKPYSALPDGTPFSTASVFDALEWGLKLTTTATGARVTQIVVAVVHQRAAGARNLLTGYTHTATGDDNFIAGQNNEVIGSGSAVIGRDGTVVGNRSVLINLDGVTRTLTGDGKFEVYGTIGGDILSSLGGYQEISEATPSGVSSVTFASLGAFTHLEIRWTARGSDAASNVVLNMTFNGDTGSNYDTENLLGSGTSATAGENIGATAALVANVASAGATSGIASSGVISIMDYRGTTFEKAGVSHVAYRIDRASNGTRVREWGFGWRSTAAITSITLTLAAGNFSSGSKFTLYGLT